MAAKVIPIGDARRLGGAGHKAQPKPSVNLVGPDKPATDITFNEEVKQAVHNLLASPLKMEEASEPRAKATVTPIRKGESEQSQQMDTEMMFIGTLMKHGPEVAYAFLRKVFGVDAEADNLKEYNSKYRMLQLSDGAKDMREWISEHADLFKAHCQLIEPTLYSSEPITPEFKVSDEPCHQDVTHPEVIAYQGAMVATKMSESVPIYVVDSRTGDVLEQRESSMTKTVSRPQKLINWYERTTPITRKDGSPMACLFDPLLGTEVRVMEQVEEVRLGLLRVGVHVSYRSVTVPVLNEVTLAATAGKYGGRTDRSKAQRANHATIIFDEDVPIELTDNVAASEEVAVESDVHPMTGVLLDDSTPTPRDTVATEATDATAEAAELDDLRKRHAVIVDANRRIIPHRRMTHKDIISKVLEYQPSPERVNLLSSVGLTLSDCIREVLTNPPGKARLRMLLSLGLTPSLIRSKLYGFSTDRRNAERQERVSRDNRKLYENQWGGVIKDIHTRRMQILNVECSEYVDCSKEIERLDCMTRPEFTTTDEFIAAYKSGYEGRGEGVHHLLIGSRRSSDMSSDATSIKDRIPELTKPLSAVAHTVVQSVKDMVPSVPDVGDLMNSVRQVTGGPAPETT